MSNTFIPVPDCINIRQDRLILRPAYEEVGYRKNKSLKQLKNEQNLKENAPSGHVNRKIKMQIQRIVSNWVAAVDTYNAEKEPLKKRKFTFVTLTLPAKQMHTDKVLHAEALNRYIQKLQRNCNVVNYLWRAERQQNGNLHYHIIVDSYIHHTIVRCYWNELMQSLGYIDAYRMCQVQKHKNGFALDKKALGYWSHEKQLNAYRKGIAENWSNPNSTDIHSLKSVDDAAKYIAKYCTKGDLIEDLQALEEAYILQKINEDEYTDKKGSLLADIFTSKINARIWGCSDKLRDLRDVKVLECAQVYSLISELYLSNTTKKIVKDKTVIIYNKQLQTIIKKYKFVLQECINHHTANYCHLYDIPTAKAVPEIEPVRDWILPTPLHPISKELEMLF